MNPETKAALEGLYKEYQEPVSDNELCVQC